MTNRIRRVVLRSHSTVPASAEIHVHVLPEQRTAGTELRGRLMGPGCPYASTVEVAYPLRPLPEAPDSLEMGARVIVPEASLWEPVSPFLYAGPVELWQDEKLCARVIVRHGLRSLSLGPRGLRLNGHPLSLRGRTITALTEAEAGELRRAGYNLLVAPAGSTPIWDLADRVGFLVLGSLRDEDVSEEMLAGLSARPCCLGFVRAAGTKQDHPLPVGIRVGVEISAAGAAIPDGAAFVICSDPQAAPPALPFFVQEARTAPTGPHFLGSIE